MSGDGLHGVRRLAVEAVAGLDPATDAVTLGRAVERLRQLGLLRACLPREYGTPALGLDAASCAATVDVLRTLGRHDLSLARIFEGHVNAAKLIAVHAREPARTALFERLASGALFAVWGADGAEPVVRRDDSLTGVKAFASGLGLVDVALVTARDGEGVRLVAVDACDVNRQKPGAWRTSGMATTLSGTFDVTALPAFIEDCVGDIDDLFCEPHFRGGIWRYCAAQLGAMESLAEIVRLELAARGRHTNPHQAHRLAASAMACETACLWVHAAAHRVETASEVEAAVAYAVLCRLQVERAAMELIQLAERALGTRAFFLDHPADRVRRDLAFYLRQADPDGMLHDATVSFATGPRAIGDLWRPPS